MSRPIPLSSPCRKAPARALRRPFPPEDVRWRSPTYARRRTRAAGGASRDRTLSALTGPRKTGRMSFHWKEAARGEPAPPAFEPAHRSRLCLLDQTSRPPPWLPSELGPADVRRFLWSSETSRRPPRNRLSARCCPYRNVSAGGARGWGVCRGGGCPPRCRWSDPGGGDTSPGIVSPLPPDTVRRLVQMRKKT